MRWFKVLAVCLIAEVCAVPGLFQNLRTTCEAQETVDASEPVSGRIIGRVWHTRVQTDDGFKYMNSVREELEIPASPVMVMMSAGVDLGPGRLREPDNAAAEVEMKGTLFFLQIQPELSLNNPISFELVGTRDRFTELVTQHGSMMGPAAELIGEDDRFEVKVDFGKLLSGVTAADDGPNDDNDKEPRRISIVVQAAVIGSDPGDKADTEAMMPGSSSTYFRYVDGIMYSSRSKALFTIELPTQDELKLSDEEAGQDLYADFDLTQIPRDMKQTFWSALETQAAVFLQRFDDEAAGEYSLRRIIAEGRLELLKRVLFDVDRARFSLRLATKDGSPIISQLRITARENSTLASVLGVLSHSGTQLAAMQDESSPLVLSTSAVIPDFVRPFATAFLTSLSLRLQEASSDTPGSEILIEDLMKPLLTTTSEGLVDATVCLRGSVKDGLVPCGAFRMSGAEDFLSVLGSVLQVTSLRDSLVVTPGTIGDFRSLSIRTMKQKVPLTKTELPLQVHLAATGSWIWFTVGDERGMTMLEELVANSDKATTASGQAVPLMVRIRLNEWLGETDDELSRIPAQWLETLERQLMKATSPKMSISMNGGGSIQQATVGGDQFKSYAAKALKTEDSEAELKVRAAEQELLVDAKIGAGLARFAVAQFLESQNRMFQGIELNFGPPSGDAKGARSGVRTFQFGTKPAKE